MSIIQNYTSDLSVIWGRVDPLISDYYHYLILNSYHQIISIFMIYPSLLFYFSSFRRLSIKPFFVIFNKLFFVFRWHLFIFFFSFFNLSPLYPHNNTLTPFFDNFFIGYEFFITIKIISHNYILSIKIFFEILH